jgi:hypothetical protein
MLHSGFITLVPGPTITSLSYKSFDTSRKELHDEIEVDWILERVIHPNNPSVISLNLKKGSNEFARRE